MSNVNATGRLAALAVGAFAAALVLTSCSDSPGGTNLAIHIENAYGVRDYVLTCDPPGGNVRDAEQLCEHLASDANTILFSPSHKSTCVGGMSTVHVRITGTYQGRAVDTEEADACEGNVVAEQLWQNSLSIPAPPS